MGIRERIHWTMRWLHTGLEEFFDIEALSSLCKLSGTQFTSWHRGINNISDQALPIPLYPCAASPWKLTSQRNVQFGFSVCSPGKNTVLRTMWEHRFVMQPLLTHAHKLVLQSPFKGVSSGSSSSPFTQCWAVPNLHYSPIILFTFSWPH